MNVATSTGCGAGPPNNAALRALAELVEQPTGTDHAGTCGADPIGESPVTRHDDDLFAARDPPLRLGDDLVIPLAGGQHHTDAGA